MSNLIEKRQNGLHRLGSNAERSFLVKNAIHSNSRRNINDQTANLEANVLARADPNRISKETKGIMSGKNIKKRTRKINSFDDEKAPGKRHSASPRNLARIHENGEKA